MTATRFAVLLFLVATAPALGQPKGKPITLGPDDKAAVPPAPKGFHATCQRT